MTGPMIEAQNGSVTLSDVDLATFLRFTSYVYIGDYDGDSPETFASGPSSECQDIEDSEYTAMPTSDDADRPAEAEYITEEPPAAEPIFEEAPQDAYIWGPRSSHRIKCKRCKRTFSPESKESKESKKEKAWNTFAQSEESKVPDCSSLESNTPWEDHSNVFLSHAKVYVFADRYDVTKLRTLAIQKLKQSLLSFNPCQQQLESLIPLIRYTYENTPDLEEIDSLRELVVTYSTFVVEHLFLDPEMTSLLTDFNRFAYDLLSRLLVRLD